VPRQALLEIPPAAVTQASAASAKIALFRSLFAGRTDVYPVRWESPASERAGYAPACAHEWQPLICAKPRIKCGECPHQAFLAVTDAVIERHLRGEPRPGTREREFVAGVYLLLPDDTCRFLALDFDSAGWRDDAQALRAVCRDAGVPVAIERSRSGNGAHVWIFFSAPVAARDARALGAHLLTATLERRPELGLQSYDRCFPSQDTLPTGGFGNLIALPLQRQARERGHSVFLDEAFEPHADQWAYLSSLPRMTPQDLAERLQAAEARGPAIPVRLPVDDEDAAEPWLQPPSRRPKASQPKGPFPAQVRIVLADELYIERPALTPSLVAALVRLAAFQNPQFYQAQALRLSTYATPRIVSCATVDARHVALPRGCLEEAQQLLASVGIRGVLQDLRESGTPLEARFVGTLREEQQRAFEALRPHDFGVLAATTAFGKTVLAAALIAHRRCSTLVLGHRRELLEQWRARLAQFLSIDPKAIGQIGAGRRKTTGQIDVAILQSLVRGGEVSDDIGGYGHLVIDECHHVLAASFEQAARRSKARYVLGLSATVTRKDGHQPIIFMQCGAVRHRVLARGLEAAQGRKHRVWLRTTAFVAPAPAEAARPSMPALYAALASDEARNSLIVEDVRAALQEGRSPLVLTERRDHLEHLRERLAPFAVHLIVLRGGLSRRERRAAESALADTGGGTRLVLATGRYLGEGFDDARLDTLFLALPIAWRGTLTQYVGRLHRAHKGKTEVRVVDYVDAAAPVLARMAAKRQAGYRALGYSIEVPAVAQPDGRSGVLL
jgi:superfamily II DNA or RNA helicase